MAALLAAASLLGLAQGQPLSPWHRDDILCPKGHCRRPEVGSKEKKPKQECAPRGRHGEVLRPRGMGEKLDWWGWQELARAGWHNVTCLEVAHGACAFAFLSDEWPLCRVVSNFLLSMLSEVNGGKKKTVPAVKSVLAPYLAGPGGFAKDESGEEPDPDEERKTGDQVVALWVKIDIETATRFFDLNLDPTALAREVMKMLKQDGFGTLKPDKNKKGEQRRPGVVVQQVLNGIVLTPRWRERLMLREDSWSVYAWHLAIGLTVSLLAMLMVGFALWRAVHGKAVGQD